MNARKAPFRRRRLGRRLRALREASPERLNLDGAAEKLELSRSTLHRLETGQTKVSVHLARSMMDLYDVYDEDLLDEVRAALKPSWYTAYGVNDFGYIDLETEASKLYDYPGMNLPGLLHTESYLRHVFAQGRTRSQKQIDSQVKVRLIRQKRLTDEVDPLELVALIDEAALRRDLGAPEVLREQQLYLVEMAKLPTVSLHVLPLLGGPHMATYGAFTLVEFPEPREQLLYHEYVTGALHIEKEDEVREARLVFDKLHGQALDRAESVALIERLASP